MKMPGKKGEDKNPPPPPKVAATEDSACNSPPAFKDLGRDASHLFTKSFNYGTLGIKCNTKTASGVEIQASGINHNDTGVVIAELGPKKKWEDIGLTMELIASTERAVKAKITVEDQLLKGFKVISETDFLLLSCGMNSSLTVAYKNSNVHTMLKTELLGTNMLGSLVLGYNNNFLGCEVGFDRSEMNVAKVDLAASKVFPDSSLTLRVSRFCEYVGSVYHKVNDTVEVGGMVNWNTGTKLCKIGGVVKYKYGPDTFLKAKVNSQSEIGLSYKQKILEGISLTVSTLVQGNRLSEGCHKYGLGIKFEV